MKKLLKIITLSLFFIITFQVKAEASVASQNQADFEKFFAMKSSLFRGRAQNFSMYNLDLQMRVQYSRPIFQGLDYEFTLASDGNAMISGDPVFPMAGLVKYEIKNTNGSLIQFNYQGQTITLGATARTLYLVESDAGYRQRLSALQNVAKNGKDYSVAEGRMVGIVTFSLFEQQIQFFHIESATNQLIRAGVFEGLDDQRK